MSASVFISHSSRDNEFCDRLALNLVEYEVEVWYDEWEIKVGDSLREKIASGIETNDYLAVVLSTASVDSDWVQLELNAALAKELAERKVFVLPLLIEDCELPTFLKDKKWADFRNNYEKGLHELLDVLGIKKRPSGKLLQPTLPEGKSHRNDELAYPDDHFEGWFIDRLEEANRIRLHRYLWNWRDAAIHITPSLSEDAIPAQQITFPPEGLQLLNKMALAGNVLVRYQDEGLFERLVDVLYDIYLSVNQWGMDAGRTSVDVNIRPGLARCALMDVVFVLGAAAIDQKAYNQLRPLIERNTPDEGYWERRGWFRYALTMAARGTPDRIEKWYLPIDRAQGLLTKIGPIGRYFLNSDRVLDCLCQFDLVQAIYWALKSERPDTFAGSYPSCAFFSPKRVLPAVKDLIARRGAAHILGTYEDRDLADIIVGFTRVARENRGPGGYAGWADEDWDDEAISTFLKQNRTQT